MVIVICGLYTAGGGTFVGQTRNAIKHSRLNRSAMPPRHIVINTLLFIA